MDPKTPFTITAAAVNPVVDAIFRQRACFKYIYCMSWYESKRHSKSCTDMYFLKEKDTRWGHDWRQGCNGADHCKIMVIKVPTDDPRYKMAVKNDAVPAADK